MTKPGAGELRAALEPAVLEDQRQDPERDADRSRLSTGRHQRDRRGCGTSPPIISSVSSSTNPITSGSRLCWRCDEVERLGHVAADGVLRPTARRGRPGTRSSRSCSIASSDPGVGLVVRHGQVSTEVVPSVGDLDAAGPAGANERVAPQRRPRAAAALRRPARGRRPAADDDGRRWSPRLGNARPGPCSVCTSGIDCGQRLEVAVVDLHAQRRDAPGRRPRRARPASADDGPAYDRRQDAAADDRRAPIRRLSRHSSGTRGRSTQRPSLASSAGSTVIEPSTATATTMIAPAASELNVASPTTNRPAIEPITAPPGHQDRVARGLARRSRRRRG